MPITFLETIPVLRIFSREKAIEFYIDYLGFKIDFEHQFEPDMPYYIGISRGPLKFHLSEHHGDGCPGANVFIKMKGVEQFHAELTAKKYRYLRPGLEVTDWKTKSFCTIDPFGNNISFNEYLETPDQGGS